MKKILTLLFAVSCLGASPVLADSAGKLGLGVVVGSPIGPTMKYWIDNTMAFDVGVGFDEDPVFYGDLLFHNWGMVNQPANGRLGFYAGVGPRFESIDHHDDEFGIRVPLGVDFLFNNSPVEIFLELAPVFVVSPDTDAALDGGVGVRFLLGN